MHIAYFTEEPLHTYPVEEARKRGDGVNALLFSNRWFDAEDAARLYEQDLKDPRRAFDATRRAFEIDPLPHRLPDLLEDGGGTRIVNTRQLRAIEQPLARLR